MAVALARTKHEYSRHLAAGTPTDPQPGGSVCPSQQSFSLECPCVDASPASRLHLTPGPNLVVVPPSLVANWLQECSTHINLAPLGMHLRYAHGGKYGNDYSELTSKDLHALRPGSDGGEIVGQVGQSHWIVITTSHSYRNRVETVLREQYQPPVPANRKRLPERRWRPVRPAWSRVIRDEAHNEINPTATTITLFRECSPLTSRWMLTGTPFERSPDTLCGWIEAFSKSTWADHRSGNTAWLRKMRAGLRECTAEKVRNLGKQFRDLVDLETRDRTKERQHGHALSCVLAQLWISRDSRSTWFGHPLVRLPPNTHVNILCHLPKEKERAINSAADQITKEMREDLEARVLLWEREGRRGPKPTTASESYLAKVRRVRVCTTYPYLAELSADYKLSLTAKELLVNGWIRTEPDRLYELMPTGSPYETHLPDLVKDNPKLDALLSLNRTQFADGGKQVVCSMSPVNALVTYWVGSSLAEQLHR